MQNKSSDDLRRPSLNHPWRTRSASTPESTPTEPSQRLNRKVTGSVTIEQERQARREALRRGITVSTLIRQELLKSGVISASDNA